MMELTAHALDLTLATPFRISRSVQTHARNVLTQIATEEAVGLGEAAPFGFLWRATRERLHGAD